MKVVVIGNGFIANHLPYPIIKDRIQPTYGSAYDFLATHKPDVVVNCIGFCGYKNVDDCEEERLRTFDTNTFLPANLSAACEKKDIHLIHIGSGCVFYGDSPQDGGWQEDDQANPKSLYSKSKYAADLALDGVKNTTILRIRMPISWKQHPRNLLSKIVGYKQVVETPNSITLLGDLSNAVKWSAENGKTGIYHIASASPICHSNLLEEYEKHVPGHHFSSISPEVLDRMVKAPRSNCILNTDKSRRDGFTYLDQDATVQDYIRRFATGKEQ